MTDRRTDHALRARVTAAALGVTDGELLVVMDEALPVPHCDECDGAEGHWVEGRFGEHWEPCPACQVAPMEWWEISEGEKP